MKSELQMVRDALKNYNLKISDTKLQSYLNSINEAHQYFTHAAQNALIVKLLREWEHKRTEKIVTASSEFCHIEGGACIYTFGILGLDWAGLSNSCSGVINQMGWNIYFIEAFALEYKRKSLGIVLIGVRTDKEDAYQRLLSQTETIRQRLYSAAVGDSAKAFLLAEEMRKLEIYGKVIAEIESIYQGDDLQSIIGMDGEAVKYFAARSRDYIENRKTHDIAEQIIRNFTFINKAFSTGSSIELDISNFETNTEGTFTSITVSGPAAMLNLEDCLKTIELTCPNYQLKHNREFTTDTGISLFRIEFVDHLGHPLSQREQEKLKNAFSMMVLDKRRDRAQWLETIGGFEQYARAIIPLLVREALSTGSTQVYHSVGYTTDLFIDFKVIMVVPPAKAAEKKLMSNTVKCIETEPAFQVLSVKPPKNFGGARVFIIDLRASLAAIDNVEAVYEGIREKIRDSIGEFRDFDEGMRTIDTTKLKSVRKRLTGLDKDLVRELYYAIEDFFRISASVEEIIDLIHIAVDMLIAMDESKDPVVILKRQTGIPSSSGKLMLKASLICISYPQEYYMLQRILEILEKYDVTVSRLERTGRDILICRITKDDKALDDALLDSLEKKILKLKKNSQV